MPGARLSMRKTREILRLRWADGRSLREIGLACGVGGTTVHDVLARAKAARLIWPLPDDLDDAASEARLDRLDDYADLGESMRKTRSTLDRGGAVGELNRALTRDLRAAPGTVLGILRTR